MTMDTIAWIACALGLLGTLMLARKGRYAGWGFLAYLLSNSGWIAFSLVHSLWPLFWQQVAFTLTSLYGLWVWVIKPRLDLLKEPAFWDYQ